MFRIKVTSNKGHNEWLDKIKHKSWEDAAAFFKSIHSGKLLWLASGN